MKEQAKKMNVESLRGEKENEVRQISYLSTFKMIEI